MYVPKQFRVEDQETIYQFIRENGFATLVSCSSDFPEATHIPIELEERGNGEKVLWGHMAKANPHWKSFAHFPQVLAIFQSPIHHYISSSWYDHANAPTYNYMSVHVRGKIRRLTEEEEWESVKRLVQRYEKIAERPIDLETLPPAVQQEINGLVGFEIAISGMDAAFKMSQNRDDKNHQLIIAALKKQGTRVADQLATIMENMR
ncbi:FMN-binding negative transcriptional regulator [Olivibacter sp. SDN3]|uniref:FMN-binding negative transcriptional regulator n=1 Tax=Olivibacter sp. SDN3 TaxID=2764720 RepID=UPI001651A727|nr:FMN-binding negative transcriptional regulator [Olivibacter sp. SDN3]QNL48233.1 FMN-binding negative transcriptional regulator [Olivibacter sp. SDN3]